MQTLIKKALTRYKQLPLPVKSSGWIFVCNILQKAMQALTIPIITRMLTTAEYGTYTVFTSWFSIIIVFSSLKLSSNGYYVGMKKYGQKSAYPSAVSGLSLLLITIWLVIAVVFCKPLSAMMTLTTDMLILMLVHASSDSAINLWYADNRYTYRYKMTAICTMFLVTTTPILKIFMITIAAQNKTDKSLATIYGLIIPEALVGVVAWYAMFHRGKKLYVKEYWKFALAFNIPLVPYYLSQVVLNQADRIMINSLDSAASAGLYSAAYALASIMQFLHAAINNGYIPWQFKTMQKGNSQKVKNVSSILTIMISVAYSAAVFCAPEIMHIFAAKEYYEAIYCIPPVVMGIFMQWITQLFINTEFYYEKNRTLSITSIVAAVINIILNAIAIPRFGYVAAAYTTLICYTINVVFHATVAIRLSRKINADLAFDFRALTKITTITAVIIFGMVVLYPYSIIRYCVLCFALVVLIIKRESIKSIIISTLNTIRQKSTD